MAENALTFRHGALIALLRPHACLALLLLVAFPAGQAASETVFPRVQAVPLPNQQVAAKSLNAFMEQLDNGSLSCYDSG
jgi:hypothetical protein